MILNYDTEKISILSKLPPLTECWVINGHYNFYIINYLFYYIPVIKEIRRFKPESFFKDKIIIFN